VKDYDIPRQGHALAGGAERLFTVPRVEVIDGKLFDAGAIQIGPPELWRAAVKEILGPNK
jgi:hypothetical protein